MKSVRSGMSSVSMVLTARLRQHRLPSIKGGVMRTSGTVFPRVVFLPSVWLVLLFGCGGGGGDDAPPAPSIQVSGQVRLANGAPAPNDVVHVEIARICARFQIYDWF